MTTLSLEEIRAEALRKVGRNVVNFQKMEAMLKYLILHNNISGPITESLQAKRKKAISRKTMGMLIDDLLDLNAKFGESSIPDNIDKAWMAISHQVFSDEEDISSRKKALKRVVAERNKLIHKMLFNFNPNSIESCELLIQELDKQKEEVDPEYYRLQQMGQALQAGRKVVQEYMLSDEFKEQIIGAPNSENQ